MINTGSFDYRRKTENIKRIGEAVFNGIKSDHRIKEKYGDLLQDFNTKKEALGNETQLYTSIISDFIEMEFQPKLIAEDIIKTDTLNAKGTDSIKIPQHNLLSASSISADGSVTADDTGYGSLTITLTWQGARTGLPIPLLEKANVDLIKDRLGQLGKAVSRKVDTDILTEAKKAATKGDTDYGDNNNYNYMGSGNDIDYDALVSAIAGHRALDAEPDFIITNPTTWKNLMQDADIKDALAFSTSPTGGIQELQSFGGMKVMVTTQCPSDYLLLVDTDMCGYLIDGSDIRTWDGRVDNKIQIEVIAAKKYGVGMVRPQAVYSVVEDTSQP